MRLFGHGVYKQIRSPSRHLSSFVKFENYLQIRRTQAEKSLLIQVSGPDSARDVRSYLKSNFGPLAAIYHYSLPGQSRRIGSRSATSIEYHWVLAEFDSKTDFDKAMDSCKFQDGVIPFRSSMCWFSQHLSGQQPSKKSKKQSGDKESEICSEKLGDVPVKIDYSASKSLSDQVQLLYDTMKISEVGMRVRFCVAAQLENSVRNLFPNGCVVPFGSSVNGVGRNSGDLDLVLLADKSEILPVKAQSGTSRLRFQTKMESGGSNSRFQSQRVMETLADIITLFVPGCSQVQRILQARVPILRFWSDFTSMQCDLSMTNASGVHMSELIYLMGCIDKRFHPLLFTIRSWASARKITSPHPGRTPTNFMLVLLLLHFLQHRKILPTFDVLFNNPATDDERITSDGIDCTFMRDATRLMKHFTPQNRDSTLAELLFEFFEFYSEFDFSTKGISLVTGGAWGKPDASAVYIQNPLERHLNVARNVSREEVARFKNECCAALWRRETLLSDSHHQQPSLEELLLKPPKTASITSGLQMKEIFKD